MPQAPKVDMPSGPRSRKPSWKNILLALASAAITFTILCLFLEILLRTETSQYHLFGVYGDLPARLQPSYNWIGLRDLNHLIEKPTDVTRVLVLGDSFTYGQGVADEDTYVRVLGRLAGPKVEVISMAMQGWSTADELNALRYLGMAYKPDIVVVGVVSNDLEPPGNLPDGQAPEWRILTRLSSRPQVFRFLDFQINRLGDHLNLRQSHQEWEDGLYDPQGKVLKDWEQAVKQFGEYLRNHQIEAYAFTLPGPGGLRSAELSAHKYQFLAQEFGQAGFHAVDLWPTFQQTFGGTPWKQLKSLPNDEHPGPAIHEFYARSIWAAIQADLPPAQAQ